MRQVDEIRAAADIVRIVSGYVKLRKSGTNLVGLCPFHQEKTPSFSVHPIKQIFHCFGCGVGGDVFKFVMLIESITFPEALLRLAEKTGVTLRETAGDGVYDVKARERVVLQKVHEVAAKFFSAQLGGTAEGRAARGYLADRGLNDQTVARFRMGYAPSQGQALARHLADAGFEMQHLESSGLVLHDSDGKRHFDRFRRRIMFPIANESGKVVAFGGRALGDDQPKYLNSPETPIYTKGRVLYHLDRAASTIRKSDLAVLVEGYMDCIAVERCGVENVVASCGTSLTEAQVRLLGRYSRRVIVSYDPDSAGLAATERSLSLLLEEGFEVRVLALPAGLDPDSFIRKHGEAEYKKLVASSPSYIDYLAERAAAQHDLETPEGKLAAVNVMMPYLAAIPNAILRSQFVSRVANRLRLEGSLLSAELKRAAGTKSVQVQVPVGALQPKATLAEKQLLRAFLDDPLLADEFLPRLLEDGLCAGLTTEGIFRILFDVRHRGEVIDLDKLEEALTEEERCLVRSSLFEMGETPGREDLGKACLGLRRIKIERTLTELQTLIVSEQHREHNPRLAQLLEAKAKLAKELTRLKVN